jgi:hypothetical protein
MHSISDWDEWSRPAAVCSPCSEEQLDDVWPKRQTEQIIRHADCLVLTVGPGSYEICQQARVRPHITSGDII